MSSSQWVAKITSDNFLLYAVAGSLDRGNYGLGQNSEIEILTTLGVDSFRWRSRGARPTRLIMTLFEPITSTISAREAAYQKIQKNAKLVTVEASTSKIARKWSALCLQVETLDRLGGGVIGFGSVANAETTIVSRWVFLPVSEAEAEV